MKTIAVDFDGVIHGYSKGWQDGSIYDPPVPGAKEAMEELKLCGYEVVIFTTRALDRVVSGKLQNGQSREVWDYLKKHDIPFTRIHMEAGKPLCKLFIDDNALRFEGNWPTTVNEVHRLMSR